MLSKIFTFIALAGLLLSLIFIGLTFNQTVCDNTLHYTVGSFDYRYEINKEDYESILLEAERIWESAFDFT